MGTMSLWLSAHVHWLALGKRGNVTDQGVHLGAAVSGRLALKRTDGAIPDLVFQSNYLVVLRVEAGKDRCGIGEACELHAAWRLTGTGACRGMTGFAGHTITAEGAVYEEILTFLDCLFQLWLGGSGIEHRSKKHHDRSTKK